MTKEYVGYRNPPKEHRFKKGRSGNPNGRPRRTARAADQIMSDVFERQLPYQSNGVTKTATINELCIRFWINRALNGDLQAAEVLLDMRKHADHFVDPGGEEIVVVNALPDP